MKKVQLILTNDIGSIRYDIDAEAKTYSSTKLDSEGKSVLEDESGQISDPQMLAQRLYLIIRAVLLEQV